MKLFRLLVIGALPLLFSPIAIMADDASPKTTENAFITKPYLQIGRTPAPGALEVLWHSPDSNVDWSVEYRGDETGDWKKSDLPSSRRVAVSGVEPHRVYRAVLTNLSPGSTCHYRVLKAGQVVFTAKARTPKSAGQAYRFVAFGDCGAGSAEQKPLARRAFASEPDFVVIPGDIVYERGLIVDYRKKFWPVYNADEPTAAGVPLIRSVPFVAAPGNHDLGTRDLNKYPDALAYYLYWSQPLNGPLGAEGGPLVPALAASDANRHAFVEAAGDAYPRMANFSFDYGNAHWTILDSNPYVNWTDASLKSWIASDLASAQNATWRFVVFHHPGFNSSRVHYEEQQMRLLAPTFEAGKVDIVFNGHVHNYQRSFPLKFVPDKQGMPLYGGKDNNAVHGRLVTGLWQLDKSFDGRSNTKPNGVIYLITGAGGQHLYNPEQTDDPDSWQKFTDKFFSTSHSLTVADVDGKTITIRQVTADGREVDRFSVTK